MIYYIIGTWLVFCTLTAYKTLAKDGENSRIVGYTTAIVLFLLAFLAHGGMESIR